MAQTRVLVAVDPATGARITRRTARTYVAVVVTGDPAQGQAHAQGWCGRPDLAARALAKWEGRCNARLAPVVEDPWAEAEAAPAPAQAEPAPVVAEPEAVDRLGFATFNPETESLSEALPPDCYPPATRRPVLPGEPEPVAARVAEAGPVTLPGEDPEAVAATLPTRFSGGGFAGFAPWDPGTPEARARVALQGERVATLWPIAQAVRGAGFDLPPTWWPDGPVMAGERTYGEALAALPLGAIAAAAAALAALPPVTAAQDRAFRLCRGEAVGV
jgi:hypothetical protein